MAFEMKTFLRQHGFRFKEEVRGGANWTNGVATVLIKKTWQIGELRSAQEQVRNAFKVKQQKLSEQAKIEDAWMKPLNTLVSEPKYAKPPALKAPPQTPEEHLAAQVAQAAVASGEDAPMEKERKRTSGYKKLSGDEKKYILGRIRAMLDSRSSLEIAQILNGEGLKQANGKPFNSTYVNQVKWHWEKDPKRAERYAKIMYPRNRPPGVAKPEVVVSVPQEIAGIIKPAALPEVPRSRFNLPLSVDQVLADSSVTDEEKLLILFVFVDIPVSVRHAISDAGIPAAQKLKIVEAVGTRLKKPDPLPTDARS